MDILGLAKKQLGDFIDEICPGLLSPDQRKEAGQVQARLMVLYDLLFPKSQSEYSVDDIKKQQSKLFGEVDKPKALFDKILSVAYERKIELEEIVQRLNAAEGILALGKGPGKDYAAIPGIAALYAHRKLGYIAEPIKSALLVAQQGLRIILAKDGEKFVPAKIFNDDIPPLKEASGHLNTLLEKDTISPRLQEEAEDEARKALHYAHNFFLSQPDGRQAIEAISGILRGTGLNSKYGPIAAPPSRFETKFGSFYKNHAKQYALRHG